jgi:hypothetical protein
VCDSESSAEYSDHGQELEGIYTSDMLDEKGHPILDRAKMTVIKRAGYECAERVAQVQTRDQGVKVSLPAMSERVRPELKIAINEEGNIQPMVGAGFTSKGLTG